MIDPFSISFSFDDRNCGNLNIMREEKKIREGERNLTNFISSSNQLQV